MRAIAALIALAAAAAPAQAPLVKVTVPKANVRSEPSDKAPILQQVTPADQIEWEATEGDWFKVRLPPNPALGGVRVEAYISKKVSKLDAASKIAASSAPAPPAEPPKPTIDTRAANVFLGSISETTLVHGVTAEIQAVNGREQWIVRPGPDAMVSPTRRPALVVSIGDRAGFSADGLVPSLVRLSVVQGTGDLAAGSTKGGKGWKADEVGIESVATVAGVWNISVSRDLKPGSYAIVLTPSSPKDAMPEFVWPFTVK